MRYVIHGDLKYSVHIQNGTITIEVFNRASNQTLISLPICGINSNNYDTYSNFTTLPKLQRKIINQALQKLKIHIAPYVRISQNNHYLNNSQPNDARWRKAQFKIMGSKVFRVYQQGDVWYALIRHRYSGDILFWHVIGGVVKELDGECPYNFLLPHEKRLVRTALYLFGLTPNQLNIRFNLKRLYERKYTPQELKFLRERKT